MNLLRIFIVGFLASINFCFCFVPARLLEGVIEEFDHQFDFGKTSTTLTHEEIIKRGVIHSVVKFFYEQPGGAAKIDLSKRTNQYYDLHKLYLDYYGKNYCKIRLCEIIEDELQSSVASVDFDSDTKDLPTAHFDSERLQESNIRVMNLKKRIYDSLLNKDYKTARQLTGKVLHTIHDFYSHSNWVEMGNVNKINDLIGTQEFDSLLIANSTDKVTCISNCTYTEIKCTDLFSAISLVIEAMGIKSAALKCPLRYYRCRGNLAVLDKLVSGYYSGQKLDDGSTVVKPLNAFKCSHGGILDATTNQPALGGINKDSGFYMFSPHADLHLIAARLAINHTEYLFNEIRKEIGDKEFSRFLRLDPKRSILNEVNVYIHICKGTSVYFNLYLILFTTISIFLFNF